MTLARPSYHLTVGSIQWNGANVMAVLEVLTFEVKPGRLDDFLSDVGELQRILSRVNVGLMRARVLRYLIAGPVPAASR